MTQNTIAQSEVKETKEDSLLTKEKEVTTEVAKVEVDHEDEKSEEETCEVKHKEDTTDEANHTNKDGNLECSMCGSEDVGDYDGEVLCHKCAEENGLSAGEFPEETKTEEEEMDAEGKSVEVPEDYKEAIETLVDRDPSLTEEFRRSAAAVFEAAVTSKIREHKQALAEEYEAKLAESTEKIENELVEKVDSYLSYVVEEWIKQNEVAVESGLRTEIAEQFMNSLKSLFTESYINIPESKKDLCSELVTKNDELKDKLAENTQVITSLTEQVNALTRESVIARLSEGLAKTQVVKLKSLIEDISFTSAEAFEEKVLTIREAYFNNSTPVVKPVSSAKTIKSVQTIVEDKSLPTEGNSSMQKYTDALSRMLKKQ